ncbi:hypothetical protein E5288_WYG005811 [Bos mutus]|uniref:Uncharacterized protein n=2 Tax=Bos mutus TaxID=72004 RepID=A0A6B0QWK7_9CETA|nr:hypothetical protein [Bos mutus]
MAAHLSYRRVNLNVLREAVRCELREFLDKCVGSKAIVWDEYLTGPFGLIAQYSLLKEHEVEKMFTFKGSRLPAADVKNITFFVRPRLELMDIVAENVLSEDRRGPARDFHLLFVPRQLGMEWDACLFKTFETEQYFFLADLLLSQRLCPLLSRSLRHTALLCKAPSTGNPEWSQFANSLLHSPHAQAGSGLFLAAHVLSLSPGSQFETSRLILTGHIYQCEQLSIGIWSFSFLGIPTAEICPWELPSPTMCSKSPTPAGQFWVVQAGNWWSQRGIMGFSKLPLFLVLSMLIIHQAGMLQAAPFRSVWKNGLVPATLTEEESYFLLATMVKYYVQKASELEYETEDFGIIAQERTSNAATGMTHKMAGFLGKSGSKIKRNIMSTNMAPKPLAGTTGIFRTK